MARTKPQEIIRRTAVPSRTSDAPDLVVHADLDSTRGYQALSRVAVDTLARVGSVVGYESQRRHLKQAEEGAQARMEADVTGITPDLSEASRGYIAGYQKTDALLRVRDWTTEMSKQLAAAEPGTDIEPILRESAAELMALPEFQNPQVRAALMPALQRAAENVRQTWQQTELAEAITRQQESLTEMVAAMVEDGSIFQEGMLGKLFDNLNTEQYSWLDHRDVNAIVAAAMGRAMATGARDPDEVMKFLEQKLPGAQVSLLSTQHGDQLYAAAEAGRNLIARRQDEERAKALATMELDLQSLAEKGRLTTKEIVNRLASVGITPETDPQTYTSTLRYWQNQQEATLKKWEAERKERAKFLMERQMIASGQVFGMSTATLKKHAQLEWDNTPPEQRGTLIRRWAALGIPIPYVENVLKRANKTNMTQAAELYHQLREVDPLYATESAGDNVAILEAHWRNVNEVGLSPEESFADITRDKRTQKDAESEVNLYWKELSKDFAEGRNAAELSQIYDDAVRFQAMHGVSGEQAIMAAVGVSDTRHTQVNGARVRNLGMPKGAEAATELVLADVAKRLDLDPDSVTAKPLGTSGLWQAYTVDGFPITTESKKVDPVTGRPMRTYVQFSPAQLAAAHQEWETKRANSKVQQDIVFRNVYKGVSGFGIEKNYDEAMRLPEKIKQVQDQIAKEKVRPTQTRGPTGKSSRQVVLEGQLSAMQKRWAMFQEASKGVDYVPADFMEYLQSYRSK